MSKLSRRPRTLTWYTVAPPSPTGVLAEVAEKVRMRKSRYSISYDMEVATDRWLRSSRAGGGSALAERHRLVNLAALCVAAVVSLDAAKEDKP